MFIPLTTALSVIEKITVDKPSKRACAGPHVVPDPRQPRAPGYDDPDPWRAATSPGQPPHHSHPLLSNACQAEKKYITTCPSGASVENGVLPIFGTFGLGLERPSCQICKPAL